MNWRGRPLTSIEVIINLIAATKTTTGLQVKGFKVEDKELASIKIKQERFHGEWNYTLYLVP
jgi:hypothetical protein